MKNSQDIKLNYLNLLIILLLLSLNTFSIFYLINNQFYVILSSLVILETIIGAIVLFILLKKNVNLKKDLDNLSESYQSIKQDYDKSVKKNKETLSELETSNAELKALNLQLIKSKKELQELSDYRGKFLVNVSHELRTPLNAVIGFTSIMTADNYDPNNEDFKDMIKVIHDSSKRLLNLINNILNIAKLETNVTEINPQEIDISAIYEAVISVAKGLLKDNEKIIFSYEIDDNIPTIIADEKYLLSALTQFIDNAIKYTERGEVALTVKNKDDNVEIVISDTGKGIPAKKLNEIQEPFLSQFNEYGKLEQLDTEKEGFSFAIAKYLIEKMGGKFTIESQEDVGTKIQILLEKA